MLDRLKNDRETGTTIALTLASSRRERSRDMDISAKSDPLISPTGITIRMVLVEPQEALDEPAGPYHWAIACQKQLVTLKYITITEILASIKAQIPDSEYDRTLCSTITKSCINGSVSQDTERLVTDSELQGFISMFEGMYIPITIQAQLKAQWDYPKNPTPPDEQPYFAPNDFDTYNPVVSDSANDLYLIQYGKTKPRAWPRSDHVFEYEKAKVWKRTNRIKKHLQQVKSRYQTYIGDRKNEIMDSDCPTWPFVKWMKQHSGQTYVKVCRALRRVVQTFQKYNIMRMARAMALDTFRPIEVGDINKWLSGEEGAEGAKGA